MRCSSHYVRRPYLQDVCSSWISHYPKDYKVRRCSFTPGSPQVDRAWFRRLKLKYDRTVLKFAFDSNLRRYDAAGRISGLGMNDVGRCKLIACNPC